MEKVNENTQVIDTDLAFLEKELTKTQTPAILDELVKKVAYKKTASQLRLEAKKYDPECIYEIDDLIYKEYDEPLTVSSKGAEPFKGAVVIKVVNKIALPDFNCEMLEVDYTGGGIFRKHIDYMKKTSTQVLLPSNCDGRGKTAEILQKKDDPRLKELPMTDKDMKKLETSLRSSLSKSSLFFNWGKYWHLEEKRIQIKDKDKKALEKHFQDAQQSSSTADIVSQLFKTPPDDESFELFCLSLNYTLENEYKKKIIFTSPEGWGKWFSKETLDSFLVNLPISKPKAKIPPMEEENIGAISPPQEFPLKLYLTWREVLSGCIKIPKALNRHFTQAREYIFTDSESGQDYTVFYYPSSHVFFGLKEFYEKNNVPQGASLTIEKTDLTHCQFSLKKAKKKLEAPILTYDPAKDRFIDSGTEAFTFSLPNKIIHIERETLKALLDLDSQLKSADLKELLIVIFKNFGLEGEALSLHYQRAFHLVDVIRRTTIEDLESVLFNSPEFSMSEKGKGLFLYRTEEEMEAEIDLEEEKRGLVEKVAAGTLEEKEEETLPEIGTVGEIQIPEGTKVIEVIEPVKKVPARVEKPEVAMPADTRKRPMAPPPVKKEKKVIPPRETPPEEPSKKDKLPKRKKEGLKPDLDRPARGKRGVKRILEERIEIEESELEALFARKAGDEEQVKVEAPVREEIKEETKEDYKEYIEEKPSPSIFADKLKIALDKKKDEEPEKPKKPKRRRK